MTKVSDKTKKRQRPKLSYRGNTISSSFYSTVDHCVQSKDVTISDKDRKSLDEKQAKIVSSKISKLASQYIPSKELKIKKGSNWIDEMRILSIEKYKQTPNVVADVKKFAKKLYSRELKIYSRTILREFKIEDKSCLSVEQIKAMIESYKHIINDSPVHTLSYLLDIISFVSVDTPETFEYLLWTIRDLLRYEYLPGYTVAKLFDKQNVTSLLSIWQKNHTQAEKEILLWYFQEEVNKAYKTFIEAIFEFIGHESNVLEQVAIQFLLELLAEHPEQAVDVIVSGLLEKVNGRPENIDNALEDLVMFPDALDTLVNLSSAIIYKSGLSVQHRIRVAKALVKIELTTKNCVLALKLLYCWIKAYDLFESGETSSDEYFYLILKGAKSAVNCLKSSDELHAKEILSNFCDTLPPQDEMIHERTLQLMAATLPISTKTVTRLYRQIYHAIQYRDFQDYEAETSFLQTVYKCAVQDECWTRGRAINKNLLQAGLVSNMKFSMRLLILFSKNLWHNKKFLDLPHKLDHRDGDPLERPDLENTQEMDEAFDVFKEASYYELALYKRHCNRKIAEVAEEVLAGKDVNYKGRIDTDFSWNSIMTECLEFESTRDEMEHDETLSNPGQEKTGKLFVAKCDKIVSQLVNDKKYDYFKHSMYVDCSGIDNTDMSEFEDVMAQNLSSNRNTMERRSEIYRVRRAKAAQLCQSVKHLYSCLFLEKPPGKTPENNPEHVLEEPEIYEVTAADEHREKKTERMLREMLRHEELESSGPNEQQQEEEEEEEEDDDPDYVVEKDPKYGIEYKDDVVSGSNESSGQSEDADVEPSKLPHKLKGKTSKKRKQLHRKK